MKLGEKLLRCRQEAGLSQRQLCGDRITRNMLSRIEHGAARPSMATLCYLAGQLGKPVSYFLEEDAALSPNQALMDAARESFHFGDAGAALELLGQFRKPDPVLEWERRYLFSVCTLAAASQALEQGKALYARQLLEAAGESGDFLPVLERSRLLLLGKIPGASSGEIVKNLPSLDEELLLRAEAALKQQNGDRAAALLGAVEDRSALRYQLLLGQSLMLQQNYAQAVQSLQLAEAQYPVPCRKLLETCFRELGDYQNAYLYACKQR